MAMTMHESQPRRTAASGRPGPVDSLYISLIPMPAAFMLATLASDILFCATGHPAWPEASEWLLGAALASGALAATDGLIRYVASGCIRPSRISWVHVIGNLLALLLSLSNLVYRLNEDPGHAVVPAGIGLTAIVMLLLIATARLGRNQPEPEPADDADDAEWI